MRLWITVGAAAVVFGGLIYSQVVKEKPAPPVASKDLRAEVVASGLIAPTAFRFLPDGRILVAEQNGVIRLIKNGKVVPKPFLDIHRKVNTYTERGLLGLAVDPDFSSNGYVYLLYTFENDRSRPMGAKTERLARVTARGDAASPSSEIVLVGTHVGNGCNRFPKGADCIPNDWQGHAGGDIAFAPDRTLFVATGDASSWLAATPDSLRSQNVDSLAGKILHVTREGKGLPTNPFWNGDPDAARSKVWAYGLRNPFRFSLSPLNGVPYVGDVGWSRSEEVDIAGAGGNFGWPCYEGRARQPDFGRMAVCRTLYKRGVSAVRPPLVSWLHTEQKKVEGTTRQEATGGAVVGGSFETGSAFPSIFDGAYFYGDYVRGEITWVQVDRDNRVITGPWRLATNAKGLVDIQFGPDGNLYYLTITGELRRVSFAGGGQALPPRRLVGRPVVHPTGGNPHSVVAADVNRDGRLDLVVADAGTSDAAILLGKVGGGFRPAVRYATDLRPKVVIAADLDGDGSLDLASSNQDANTVSVLLGNGDGTFRRHHDFPACARPHDIVSADLDGDGQPDLAVACYGGTVVSVLKGRGDGTFAPHVDYRSGGGPHSLVARDFNGDGRPDLAVANWNDSSVGVLLATPDGAFAPAVTYAVGTNPHRIAAGDLDGDGRVDLVTANEGSSDASVLLGRGDGTFAKATSYPAGPVPKGLAVGDLNGDGHADVVTANTDGNYLSKTPSPFGETVSVLLGTGDGRLGPPGTYLAGPTPFSVAIADLDGDGHPELATANWYGNTVSVLPGPGGAR